MQRRTFVKWTTLGSLSAGGSLFAQTAEKPTHSLPALPYPAAALEPHIDAETMNIHHGKHHAAYVTKLNEALGSVPALAKLSLDALMPEIAKIPLTDQQSAIRNNGGGHWNHSFFWASMAPTNQKSTASEALDMALQASFGSMEKFRAQFTDAALKRFGSGWVWLISQNGKLRITSTPNQDNPIMRGIVPETDLGKPLLGIDVWEHAYYLHYQNRRVDYVNAWWNVIDWNQVNSRFDSKE